LHGAAQLIARFARDDFSRGAEFCPDQAANDGAREFSGADETEAMARGGCL